jgi:hypothetical protein
MFLCVAQDAVHKLFVVAAASTATRKPTEGKKKRRQQ